MAEVLPTRFIQVRIYDNYNNEDLLKSLRPLLRNIKLYKSDATLLKEQLESIKNSLGENAEGILEYNAEITKQINKVNEIKNTASSCATGSCIVAGIGFTAAVVAAPFTGGISLFAAAVAAAAEVGTLAALGALGGNFFLNIFV
ncbi:hypothetical protein RclHR1_03470014 [Rhizophagus clarus]|uniref:Uncharacterized protein n=1 Tax=Rhizophagus clarus TaxID=94130 RepID=A0A2Z6RQB9_9GLOM|nr:hypothetical protein RclHR1_03470014 [Rhizophagus clarus]